MVVLGETAPTLGFITDPGILVEVPSAVIGVMTMAPPAGASILYSSVRARLS